MTLRSVMLQLREDQIALLDADAVRTGTSRSRLVRDAVDAALSPAVDDDIAERYRRSYPGGASGSDAWGDLDSWHEAAAQDRARAERDPW